MSNAPLTRVMDRTSPAGSARLPAAIAVVAIWVLASCAGPARYYETGYPVFDQPQSDAQAWAELTTSALGERRLTIVESGQRRPLGPGDLAMMDASVVRALLHVLEERFIGAEVDLLVPQQGAPTIAISFWVDEAGDVEMARGLPPARRSKTNASHVQARFGTGPLHEEGATWRPTNVHSVQLALAQLSPEELAVVSGMPIVRLVGPGGTESQEGGIYISRACDAQIQIYNLAFTGDRHRFVGSLERPFPNSVFTVLHEVGHALHRHRRRMAHCRHEDELKQYRAIAERRSRQIQRHNALVPAANGGDQRAVTEIRRLADALETSEAESATSTARIDEALAKVEREEELGTVLEAYEKVLSAPASPTRYGETSLAESFAESFALFRSDPAALERIMPPVARWFAKGGHIAALQTETD